jgi:hypothetical protein
MHYNFTKAIARAKAKEAKMAYMDLQSQNIEYEKELNKQNQDE